LGKNSTLSFWGSASIERFMEYRVLWLTQAYMGLNGNNTATYIIGPNHSMV